MEQAYWENHLYKCKFIMAILQVRHVSLLLLSDFEAMMASLGWSGGGSTSDEPMWVLIGKKPSTPGMLEQKMMPKWVWNYHGVAPKLHVLMWGNHDFRWFPTFVEQICCCPHHFCTPLWEIFHPQRTMYGYIVTQCVALGEHLQLFPWLFPSIQWFFQGAMSYELTRTTMRFRGCWSCR